MQVGSSIARRPSLWALLALVGTMALDPVTAPFERRAYDARLALRQDHGWPRDLVLVPIDDDVLQERGRWPWPRDEQARLLNAIRALGARTILYDMVVDSGSTPEADAALAGALDGVVLGIGFSRAGRRAGTPVPEPLRRSLVVEGSAPYGHFAASTYVPSADPFARRSAGLGHLYFFTGPDRIARGHAPLLGIAGRSAAMPSAPLLALLHQRGHLASEVRASRAVLDLPTGKRLPLQDGELLLDFVPREDHGRPRVVRAGTVLGQTPDPELREAFEGALALVYLDSVFTNDLIATPMSESTTGGLAQAYAIRTLDGGRVPRRFPRWLYLLVVAGPVFLATPRLLAGPPVGILASMGMAAAGAVALGVVLVPSIDLFLPVVAPAVFLLLTGALLTSHATRAAEVERKQLRALLQAATGGSASIPGPASRPTGAEDGGPPARLPTPSRSTELVHGDAPADTIRLADPPPPYPGRSTGDVPVVLGRYLIGRQLGKGGMGAIYHARDRDLDREVAIKVLEAADKSAFARFRREALAIGRISHPNVVQIHEVGFDAQVPYLVMEYVPGGTLTDLLRDPNGPLPLPWERATRIVAGVARGLGAAHAHGIVHRDVKPSNLLLVDRGADVAKVADFGIAKLADVEALTREGSFVGTIGYLSPEQALGAKVDARSDVYSLGLTWYRLLTGKAAFQGTAAQVLRATASRSVPDPRDVVPALPDALAALLQRMTALDRAERPSDGHTTATELESLIAGTPG